MTYRRLHIVAKLVEAANAILMIGAGGRMQLPEQVFDLNAATIGIVLVTHRCFQRGHLRYYCNYSINPTTTRCDDAAEQPTLVNLAF
jgi:hypothetical protein